MSFIFNLLWFIFIGFELGCLWIVSGIGWAITIIGLPFAKQCFKNAGLSFFPFNKEVYTSNSGTLSLIMNILWIVFTGAPFAFAYLVAGCLLYITVIGIPLANQCFKLARVSFMPFGTRVA